MNKTIKNSIALGAFILLAACNSPEKAATHPMQAPTVRVTTIDMTPIAVVLYSEMPGRTLAFEEAEVRPEVTGIIQERVFHEGSTVKKGDTLYLIDSDLYKASYDSAKANQARAEAALNVAKVKNERIAILRRRNAVSQQDYDETNAIYLQAKAEVAASRAAVQSAKINLDRTHIQAPISGLIGKSTVSVGTLLATNQANPLTTIYQINPMNIDLTQSAQELVSIRQQIEAQGKSPVVFKTDNLNLPVILLMNDGTKYKHQGLLRFIDVGVDKSTATMTLRAEFPNPDHILMPGLFVRAKLQIGVEEKALLLPQKSVLRNAKGQPYVFVAENMPATGDTKEKSIKAKRRFVTLGAVYGENWLVIDGIDAGEKVILEGLQKVTEDANLDILSTAEAVVPADADYLLKNAQINMNQEEKLNTIVEEEFREIN